MMEQIGVTNSFELFESLIDDFAYLRNDFVTQNNVKYDDDKKIDSKYHSIISICSSHHMIGLTDDMPLRVEPILFHNYTSHVKSLGCSKYFNIFHEPYQQYIDDELSNKIFMQDDYDSSASVDEKYKLWYSKWKFRTDAENCKLCYDYCVAYLKSINVIIESVTTNLNNFRTENITEIDNHSVFIFHCSKNNYKYDVEFILDGDVYPGLLYVKSIKNIVTNVVTYVECDLRCNNTTKEIFNELMLFMEMNTMSEYINKKYGMFFELEELLTREGIICHTHNNIIKKLKRNHLYAINNGNSKSEFYIALEHHKKTIYLIPYTCEKTDYNINLYVNETNTITPNDWNNNVMKHIDYRSKDDFPLVLTLINNYVRYINEDYGVKQITDLKSERKNVKTEHMMINDKTITRMLETHLYDMNNKSRKMFDMINIHNYADLLSENDYFELNIAFCFNVSYIENPTQRRQKINPKTGIGKDDIVIAIDSGYYIDCYNIMLKKSDDMQKDKFVMTIECRGIDFLKVAKKYTKDIASSLETSKDNFDVSYMDDNAFYVGTFAYEGSIIDCISYIKRLMKHFMKINDAKTTTIIGVRK